VLPAADPGTQIVKRGSQGVRGRSSKAAVAGPFIYTPFSRAAVDKRKGTQWVRDELGAGGGPCMHCLPFSLFICFFHLSSCLWFHFGRGQAQGHAVGRGRAGAGPFFTPCAWGAHNLYHEAQVFTTIQY